MSNSTLRMIMMIVCLFGLEQRQGKSEMERLQSEKEAVVLLHGHSRTGSSMKKLARYLTDHGYAVFTINYPSREKNVEELADTVLARELPMKPLDAFSRVHVVTHSMGGLIIHHYLQNHPLPGLGKVVMLSPPSQGSEIVDRWMHSKIFRWWMGPSAEDMKTDREGETEPDYPLGILTGSRSINWILSLQIPGQDDGKVSVERAKMKGMTDFRVLPVSHPFIMKDKVALAQVVHFLRYGRFTKDDQDG